MHREILAIVGPTASGKTALGLRLARELDGEIVSVDSRQVYRHLSVGTAKPVGHWETRGEAKVYRVEGIPYHLSDILAPTEAFSAAQFVTLATAALQDIQARGRTPIFVGGTGLYFQALTEGLASLPNSNPAIRRRLRQEADEKGREALHRRLQTVDPIAAAKIPANNIQRLIRALEVFEISGKPISQWHQEHQNQKSPDRPSLRFQGIDLSREELVRRIEARCRTMMKEGMVEETDALLRRGVSEAAPAFTGLGYPRIIALLKGSLTTDECLRLLIQDTRQYAKRQMTWFRHQLNVEWKK